MHGWMDGWMNEVMGEWVDEKIDGWMDGWLEGWTRWAGLGHQYLQVKRQGVTWPLVNNPPSGQYI